MEDDLKKKKKYHIVDTTATKKVFELTKRIRAVSGGTSASKTVSILIWLIDYCQREQDRNKLCSVVSETYPHLQRGAILDFQIIMKDRGYWNGARWNDSKHVYTFETGNKLEFYSVDTFGKAHGPRRDVLFVNEANNMAYNIVDQLITRTREIIFMDWNPSEEFWFYTEMLGKRDDIDFIKLTYLDNEGLDEVTKQEILSHRHNKMWWQVYGLGLLGEVEGRIYTGWQMIDEIPFESRLWRYGMDFGYSNDPASIVAIYEVDGGFILDEILYQKGMSNKNLADVFKNTEKALVIADSAEPKSIAEIRSYGIPIIPCTKGRDSVLNGIQYVQDLKISVTKQSLFLIKEYRNYMWIKDKNGKIINEPSDVMDHLMDALRYGLASGTKTKWVANDPGGVAPLIPGMIT